MVLLDLVAIKGCGVEVAASPFILMPADAATTGSEKTKPEAPRWP
jgi:hypothetical protein